MAERKNSCWFVDRVVFNRRHNQYFSTETPSILLPFSAADSLEITLRFQFRAAANRHGFGEGAPSVSDNSRKQPLCQAAS